MGINPKSFPVPQSNCATLGAYYAVFFANGLASFFSRHRK